MLLVIHNLPSNTRYSDVKNLIKQQCGITEMIVDNLMPEREGKKVTVGCADEADAALIMRKLNGAFVGQQQIYIENAKPKKTEEAYKQTSSIPAIPTTQYAQGQYNLYGTTPYANTYYPQQNQNPQYYPQPTPMVEPQQTPNFGVPFYMTAANPSVDNSQQHMVQYPQVHVQSDTYGGQNHAVNRGYDGGDRNRAGSPKRGPGDSRPSTSRWSDSDRGRSDGWKARDKTPPHDHDRYREDRSYKDVSYQEYHSRSKQRSDPNQSYRSDNQDYDRHDKSYDRSEPNRSEFGQQNQSFRSNTNDYKKVDERRHYEHQREPKYSQIQDFALYMRRDDYQKTKRPYEHEDVKNDYEPPNKKTNSREFHSKNYAGNSGNKQFPPKNQPSNPGGQHSRNRGSSPPHNKSIYLRKMAQQGSVPPPPQKNYKPSKNGKKKQRNVPKNKKDLSVRQEGWMCQASSVIAQKIMKNVSCSFSKKHPVVLKLKACVRSRLDVLMEGAKDPKLNDMLARYRQRFNERDDLQFYPAVVNKVNKAEIEEFDAAQKERLEKRIRDENNPLEATKPKEAKTPVQPKPQPDIQFVEPNPDKKLPKHPNASKKVTNQMKKVQKEELLNDSLYTLDNMGERILNKEFDILCNMFQEELQEAQDEAEQSIGQFLNSVVLPNMRKVMSLLVKKRVLDIRTNLAVRVICQPKCPNRTLLDTFVRGYGVVSLKKSDLKKKLYIAICNSFENYDALIRVGHTFLGGIRCTFKPLFSIGNVKSSKNNTKKQLGNEDNDIQYDEEGEEMGEGNEEGEGIGEGNEDEGEGIGEGNEEGEGMWEMEGDEQDCSKPSGDDVMDKHNESTETIVIEEDLGNTDQSDAMTGGMNADEVDDITCVDGDHVSYGQTVADDAIDFAADDLEDF